MKFATLPLALLLLPAPACAGTLGEAAGDAYRITLFHESKSEGENGSTSSSRGGHEYIERVLTIRSDGVERFYDLPLEPDDEERLINWAFPVRVFEASDGSIQILNRAELEQRRDAWLKAVELPSEACGSWYFTWNAFQVECDPDAIIETIRAISIQPEKLAVGASFHHPAAVKSGQIVSVDTTSQGTSYSVRMAVNPDYFHRTEAEGDVVVGELMRKPISYEDAYDKRRAEQIKGTIKVVFDANPEGRVWRRATTIKTEKVGTGGEVEHTVTKETVERMRLDAN